MPDDGAFALGVLLLGAGFSVRMGTPKLLLPWDGTTVIGHTIAQWRKANPEQIVVVCRADDTSLHQELDRLQFSREDRVINPAPENGMFSSIQTAARWPGWRAALTHWAIALGDQPQLSGEILAELTAFASEHRDRVCQPSYRGRARHPVILPRNQFRALGSATDEHLQAFLQRTVGTVARCEIDDPGLELDLDTRSDYQAALARFGGASGNP